MFENIKKSLFLVIAVLSLVACGSEDSKEAAKAKITGTPLAYTEIKKETNTTAAINHHRLYVTITPNTDQSKATQADLAATVMTAAMAYQEESGLPVVNVNMVSQQASNPYGELQLAIASYIPDGKGYNGEQEIGPWDKVMATTRGFTNQELEYLRNWADMRTLFMNVNEQVNDEALDAAISKKMGVAAESLTPHYNFLSKVE